ncbi:MULTISPECIES: J domain-containing protein [Actinoalloteichus]|nr:MULTISPECIES: DnaJ domain-containing protein [Actinoalloteichus]
MRVSTAIGVGYMVDHYELLGVRRSASAADIKTAYRQLAKTMHPDAGGTSGAFRLLTEAYETLYDPVLRAEYDRSSTLRRLPASRPHVATEHAAPLRRTPWLGRNRSTRKWDLGEDPDYVPPSPRIDPRGIPWWDTLDVRRAVRYLPSTGLGHAPLLLPLSCVLVLVTVAPMLLGAPVTLVAWLLLVSGAVTMTIRAVRRQVAANRLDEDFVSEFGTERVFGKTGDEREDIGRQLTADLLDRYLTRLPGARIFHGLAWPGSVFADVDHAVLCGRRLVLIESKKWLPGHYVADEDGTLWRNGHVFRGGSIRLPEAVAAYRTMLPDVEVRGALLLYPSRTGRITTDEPLDDTAAPMNPEWFLEEIGGWLAEDAATVDRELFRTVLAQVVS